MSREEILESLELEGNEPLKEKAAKIILWFLDSPWDDTWTPEDSSDFSQYVQTVAADLKDSR